MIGTEGSLPKRRVRVWLTCVSVVLALQLVPAFAAGVGVVGIELTDNGDDDGFADTLETVELRPTIHNTTEIDLRNVVLHLSTSAPEITCVSRSRIAVGDLAAGEIRRVDGTFAFTVGDVDRVTLGLDADSELLVAFDISISGDQFGEGAVVPTMSLDLDLDVSGGSGRTEFFEGFESGSMSTFTHQNLDAGRNDLSSADGYRCQYADPDWINSSTYGTSGGTYCYLGVSASHADAAYWQVDGPGPEPSWPGRGFGGQHSLYYGLELGPALGHTTPISTLEAVATTEPINLDSGRTCEGDSQSSCVTDLDCPMGQRCVMRLPALSIKHQIHLYFRRSPPDSIVDRAVVQAQLADNLGQPAGPWTKIASYTNTYSSLSEDWLIGCSFDPVDDGNTEDDFFDPSDPARRLGPSSTCYPERVFGLQGDTFDAFDPTRLGLGEGPGLEGETGPGTWVESRFDLSRFRGRRVRLRFLTSSIRYGPAEDYEQLFVFNPTPYDDGWWIDDVTVSHALTSPASIAVDTTDNSLLPGLGDGDGDGTIDTCDPCPGLADPTQLDSDGDGLGDLCDNCPTVHNADQVDSDGDGIGNGCDRCPTGDLTDEDGDGVPCVEDNCAQIPNPSGVDSDADGSGDACDPCPFDEADDADGDGFCSEVDNCPQRFNPDQTAVVRVVVPQRLGEVTSWDLTPDSRRIVYVADQDLDEQFGIYSATVTGGASVRLGTAGPFLISPDSSAVLYVADEGDEGGNGLYQVPIDGGPRVKLSGDLVPGGQISGFTISPDGQTALYIADQEVDETYELYSVPVAGGTPVKLNGPMPVYGAIDKVLISPDSSTAVYRGDQDTRYVIELYSVPIAGGTTTKLNGVLPPSTDAGIAGTGFAITSDGAHVIYVADQETYQQDELYSVPIGGGVPTKLHGELLAGTDVTEFAITPDGSTVIFNATPVVEGAGLFATDVGDGSMWKIAPQATFYQITADGGRVVFHDGGRLSSVPVSGGSSALLDDQVSLNSADDMRVSPDDVRVVYHERFTDRLYSVQVSGGPRTLLSSSAVALRYYMSFDISPDSSAVFYVADELGEPELDQLYNVPIAGGASIRVNDPLPSPQLRAIEYRISPDGTVVTYLANQFREDRRDLMAKAIEVDPDGDGLLFFCDSCPQAANPRQEDRDGDLVGDVCDTCPWDWNDSQTDSDSDGAGDECDCAPADQTARPPAEVASVTAEKPVAGTVRLRWPVAAGADAYGVSRALISQLSTNQLGQCIETNLTQLSVDDEQPAPPGDGFAYLIKGIDTVCGGGSLGPGAGESERINLDPLACP